MIDHEGNAVIIRKLGAIAVCVAAVVATAMSLATPASAANPVPNVVSAAGQTTDASIAAKASPTNSVTIAIDNFTLTCPASSTSLGVTLYRGPNSSGVMSTIPASGVKFGTATYSGPTTGGGTITPGSAPCTSFGGTVPLVVKSCSTWGIQTTGPSASGVHYPSAPVASQVTPTRLFNLCVEVYLGASNSCRFRVAGIQDGSTYRNDAASGVLNTAATPTTTATVTETTNPTSGCLAGAIHRGSNFRMFGTFGVTAAMASQNPVWVDA